MIPVPDLHGFPHDPTAVFAGAAEEEGAILLESQKAGVGERYSYLLRAPVRTLVARGAAEVVPTLEEAGALRAEGFVLAGFVAFEAGFALDPAFRDIHPPDPGVPLAWFGVYRGFLRYDHWNRRWTRGGRDDSWPHPPRSAQPVPWKVPAEPLRFSLSEEDHGERVETIRRAIARGEVYQANLTGKFFLDPCDDPFPFYLRLRAAQPVPYGAFLRTGREAILSQSPELFFRVRGERIEARPMKGTAPRGLTDAEDRALAAALKRDPKNRAENVMIVDLLRNDLGRVCRPGTVRVPRLFEVQKFATVLQMVSAVEGRLDPQVSLAGLFRAMFPCGSVTGAPKIAAMRLLHGLEPSCRGVYTGAIGILLPGGDTTFSVAIRTVVVRDGRAEAGAGGGIVWDSSASGEFREIGQKGLYLTRIPPEFDLLETFLWSPRTGYRHLPFHLRRMAASARYFGFRFPRERILDALESAAAGNGNGAALRARLLLRREGKVSVSLLPLPDPPDRPVPWRVRISGVAVSSRDPFLRHKTTNRDWRDAELRKARDEGFDEVLFRNERGELTEGAITNLFLEIGGRLVTPPVSCGLLDGVCRRILLKERRGRIEERILHPGDIARADRILLTNSVRGMIPATFPAGPRESPSRRPSSCRSPRQDADRGKRERGPVPVPGSRKG